MPAVIDCPKSAERDLAAPYLAGKLSAEDAAAFEEHYFACEACRKDVEVGSQLRALYGKAPIAASTPAPEPRRTWLPLVAAAAIAVVGIGVWQATRKPAESPLVSRSGEAAIAGLKAAAARGGFEVTWEPFPRAASYQVRAFGAGSRELWRSETRQTRARVESAALGPPEAGGSYAFRVDALDALGQVVASGEVSAAPSP